MEGFPGPGRSESRTRARSRSVALALFAAAFAVVLWGGYGHRWSWTGINGTTATLWDWLHLLLLPLLLPTLVVPLMMPIATSRLDLVRPARAPAEAADDVQPADGPRGGREPRSREPSLGGRIAARGRSQTPAIWWTWVRRSAPLLRTLLSPPFFIST